MEVKRDQALALKKELEDGLEKWSKQVLEVQENNLKRAEEKVEDRNKLRRQRSREERRGREKRVMERRKESKEREAEDLKMKREAISSKEKRVNPKMNLQIIRPKFYRLTQYFEKEKNQWKDRENLQQKQQH